MRDPECLEHRLRHLPNRSLSGKPVAEHGPTALRFGLRRFVLNHVPMLDQHSIDQTNEVRNDPVLYLAEARKTTVHDHEFAVRHNLLVLMLEHRRHALDQIEETVATGLDVGAVLHVVR